MNKILTSKNELKKQIFKLKKKNKKIVLVHGVFDIFHLGHLYYFEETFFAVFSCFTLYHSILEEYNKNLKEIEEEYGGMTKEMAIEKKKALDELIEKGYGDPDELAKKIAELYGLESG